jgi:ABC-type antimicrobial peptide transport system permease subunit
MLGGYLGYFATKMLMRSIWTYYLDVSLMHVLLPIILTIIISVVTIFRKVYLAANQNPVDALKYE